MKKVLIIGAGFLQAYVIRRAKELGYYTLAVDANRKSVGFKYADEYAVINIVDKQACLAYAMDKEIDGVLTAATDYGVLTAAYIAKEMGLPGLNYDTAKLIKNKYLIRSALSYAHVDDTSAVYEIKSVSEAENIADVVEYPVMVKPCDGSGSRGASRVECKEELPSAIEAAIESSLTKCALIEKFIFGHEYGAEAFVYNGNVHVMALMNKEMTEHPYYAELGHEIPTGLDAALEKKVANCVVAAVRTLNINFGAVNMDLLITSNKEVHIVDIGARMGGNLIGSHIVPLTTGIDYVGNLIKIAVGDEPDMSAKEHSVAVATRLLALSPGKVSSLPDFSDIEARSEVKIEHHLVVGDTIDRYRTNLDGKGYIIATSSISASDARERAAGALAEIDRCIERE